MTIVASKETRNSQWANDTNAYGRKMLEKMGWKGDGAGLGKNQHGTTTHLRAVRRVDSLGIGAENDSFGDKGWQDTNAGFHGVLASLKSQYSGVGSGSGSDDEENDKAAKKKRKKDEKKRKKKEEKRRTKNSSDSNSDGNAGSSSSVRLPQNKVQAGHARKMREAKDIRNKSAADMAAIFGVKADFYKQPRDWGVAPEENKTSSSSDDAGDKKKKKSKKKKSKESKENELDVIESAELKKDKKKRKRSSDSSDSEDKKKSKKDKTKK